MKQPVLPSHGVIQGQQQGALKALRIHSLDALASEGQYLSSQIDGISKSVQDSSSLAL